MNMGRHRFGAAKASYTTIDLSSRIEGATPHQLVAILFDELLKALEAMEAAAARRDTARVATCQSRALSVLFGLESSLDMERGGEIAQSLSSIYKEARRLTVQAGRDCDANAIAKARGMIGEIVSAWSVIGAETGG